MSAAEKRIVLVTGGSGGLGKAIAGGFAAEGYTVIITSRDEAKLGVTAAEISASGGQVAPFACDVTKRDQVKTLCEKITAQLGPVQILVNNAGIARAARLVDMPDELWDDTLATNLTGAYNCCKAFLPGMLKAKWGRVINIASTTAKVGYSHVTAYTASKHGLLGLTRSLALETAAQGVTVNAICPGYVDDERTRENARVMAEKTGKSADDILRLFASSAPQNRLISAGEVASLALLLASEKLSGMTGQAINVDGGAVMA
jgi:NAD(P)-dependent dehydrogenase (short-subunit alcohol dehydrogenase family)